jgi:hypothetical protein
MPDGFRISDSLAPVSLATAEEAEALQSTAQSWGLTRDQVLSAHHSYLESLVMAAFADGRVTFTERQDLEAVASSSRSDRPSWRRCSIAWVRAPSDRSAVLDDRSPRIGPRNGVKVLSSGIRSPRGEAEARQRSQEDGPATLEGEEGAEAGRPRRVGQGRQQREAVAA